MVWVAVICDDCLINYISSMLVCFCFSRFFCFFLWAFGVTNFSPIKVARRPTPDPKSQQEMHIFGNSAKQNGIISWLEWNWEYLVWMQKKSWMDRQYQVCISVHASQQNDWISKKINCVQGWQNIIKGMAQIQVNFSLRMILEPDVPGSKQKYGMYSERRIVLQNPVSYKKSITKIVRWLYMWKSVRISQ